MLLAQSSDGTTLLIQLIVMLVFGVICAFVASGRGRSSLGWFFVGVFFSCLGLVVLLALPDLKQEEARQRRQALENRRLREQLRKERQVADMRHAGVHRRLGVHDEALGVDTSGATAELAAGTGAPLLPPPLPAGDAQWYYARGQEKLGPVSADTLRHLLETGAITRTSLVWCRGMENWQELSVVPEFEDVADG
jgi:hypothetical protein